MPRTIFPACLIVLLSCSEEPPALTVGEFMENPRELESAMVRCAQNRSATRYEAECLNAREAGILLEAGLERERRKDLEKQSERKRQALRRTQEAVAEARRRADAEQRRREDAELLGVFEDGSAVSYDMGAGGESAQTPDNAPAAIIETSDAEDAMTSGADDITEDPGTDLESVRKELERRQQESE